MSERRTRTEYDVVEREYEVADCEFCGQEVPVDELEEIVREPSPNVGKVLTQSGADRAVEEALTDMAYRRSDYLVHLQQLRTIDTELETLDEHEDRVLRDLMNIWSEAEMTVAELVEGLSLVEVDGASIDVCEHCADSLMDPR